MSEQKMERLNEVLDDIDEYLEGREDADHNGDRYIPNKEMCLLIDLRKARAASTPEAAPDAANHFVYAAEESGVTFEQAASVACALVRKGWRIPEGTPEAAGRGDGWIDVKQELPPVGRNVAILVSAESVAIHNWATAGYYHSTSGGWWHGVPGDYRSCTDQRWTVTHWAYLAALPAPPSGEQGPVPKRDPNMFWPCQEGNHGDCARHKWVECICSCHSQPPAVSEAGQGAPDAFDAMDEALANDPDSLAGIAAQNAEVVGPQEGGEIETCECGHRKSDHPDTGPACNVCYCSGYWPAVVPKEESIDWENDEAVVRAWAKDTGTIVHLTQLHQFPMTWRNIRLTASCQKWIVQHRTPVREEE